MHSQAILKVHTAKKEWRCDAGFTCVKADPEQGHSRETPKNVITPGERYYDEVIPPWVMTQDDPDGTPFRLGEWIHNRFHIGCYGGY